MSLKCSHEVDPLWNCCCDRLCSKDKNSWVTVHSSILSFLETSCYVVIGHVKVFWLGSIRRAQGHSFSVPGVLLAPEGAACGPGALASNRSTAWSRRPSFKSWLSGCAMIMVNPSGAVSISQNGDDSIYFRRLWWQLKEMPYARCSVHSWLLSEWQWWYFLSSQDMASPFHGSPLPQRMPPSTLRQHLDSGHHRANNATQKYLI